MPGKLYDLQEALANGEFYMSLRLEENEFACNDYDDPEDYVHDVSGRVTLADTAGKELAEIGKFRVIQIDTDGIVAQGASVMQAFDLTQETWDFYEELFDPEEGGFKRQVLRTLEIEDDVVPWGVLILSDLEIYPEYRRKNFGLLAAKTLIQRFRMGVGIVAAMPFPDQYRGEYTSEQLKEKGLAMYRGSQRASTLRLRAHFSQLGFRLIPDSEVMALSPIRALENVPLTTSVLDGC